MKSISDIYSDFKQIYNDTNDVLADSTFLYQNQAKINNTIFSDKIHHYIIEHCFMRIYLAWENFIENAFKLYLCDREDMQGNRYIRYAFPVDEEHAYNMLRGTKQYPDWTNIGDINTLSNTFFENAGPFSLLNSNPVELQHMKTIRNRISHTSEKSIRSFNNLTNSHVAITGLSAAEFLSKYKDTGISYYSFYTDILMAYVEAICNKQT